MTPQSLSRAITDLGNSVNLLHRQGLLLPSMMMLYATIDIMAGLARAPDAEESTRADFKAWVDRYMLPDSDLACNADDLWGARCGLLHMYVPESRHSRTGRARKLLYVAGVIDESIRETTRFDLGEYIVVVSQDIFNALSCGLQRFIDDLETDAALVKRVAKRADRFLVAWSPER